MTRNATPEEISVNIGPYFPAASGPLCLRLQTDGEMVTSGEPEVGYIHRGLEKIAERTTWAGFMPYADRIDYLAATHCSLAYAMAVEALAVIPVSDRAQHIRVIVCELNRISSHLVAHGTLAGLLGASTFTAFTLREREKVNNLFEMLCGARVTYNYLRIGGVASDFTEGFIEKTYEFIDQLLPRLGEYEDLLSANAIFAGRLGNLGAVSPERAIAHGISGPALRACGMAHDLRKAAAYSGYHHFEFNVPTGHGEAGVQGDAYDRFVVRLREIEQSASIIKQALDTLPSGAHLNPLPRFFKPSKGEAYAAVESPRGVFGVYVSSSGEKNPFRMKVRAPSFSVLSLLPEVLRGLLLSDVATAVASFDIMVSEVDR